MGGVGGGRGGGVLVEGGAGEGGREGLDQLGWDLSSCLFN